MTADRRQTVAGAHSRIAAGALVPVDNPLVGVECEWLTYDGDPGRRFGRLTDFASFKTALSASADDLHGSLTFEAGGQVEISSKPHRTLTSLIDDMARDDAVLGLATADIGVTLRGRGLASAAVGLANDADRYRAAAAFFAAPGVCSNRDAAPTMMCTSASVQINVDLPTSHTDDAWILAQRLAPILGAVGANSPGTVFGRSYLSSRLATWELSDRTRTDAVPETDEVGAAAAAWADYALDARVMLFKDGATFAPTTGETTMRQWLAGHAPWREATAGDVDYHMTTLFPPLRPRGFVELRTVDAQPNAGDWIVPVAVAFALIVDAGSTRAALSATDGLQLSLSDAARLALHDDDLAQAAQRCFEIALETPTLNDRRAHDAVAEHYDRFVRRRLTPADETLAT